MIDGNIRTLMTTQTLKLDRKLVISRQFVY